MGGNKRSLKWDKCAGKRKVNPGDENGCKVQFLDGGKVQLLNSSLFTLYPQMVCYFYFCRQALQYVRPTPVCSKPQFKGNTTKAES